MTALLQEIRSKWKPRKKASHKGDYGRVFILAGSRDYSGAAYLSGLACLRMGAGLVTLGVPDRIHAIVARRQPELIVKSLASTPQGSLAFKSDKEIFQGLKNQDVLGLGPGLSQNRQTQKLIRKVISKNTLPAVIDADGLNALSQYPEILKRGGGHTVITPHPGEFLKLFGGTLNDSDTLRKNRALEAAKQTGCFVVLKGRHTVVANPDGRVYQNTTGNPGMATAGAGDVLTGMIAALLGQKFSLWDSARFAVYLHGLSGDLAARKKGPISLIAGDLMEFLPQAIQNTLSK